MIRAAALFSALLALPCAAQADDLANLLTGQHANYALTLSKLRTHDITGATGQMSFNIIDGCTGWATNQRMTLIIRNADGTLTTTVSDYVTWESKDEKTFTFSLTENDNGGKTQIDDAGTATHNADGSGVVSYTTPANTRLTLPVGTLFPMQHTEALLAAGRDDQKFISPPLFDGTSATGAQATFVAVLGHLQAQPTAWPALNAIASTSVDIAFYTRKNDDEQPNFRTSMRYFEDGVATDLVLDFGDFEMGGKLTSLTIPPSGCTSK
jgi:hypothetical protein